VSFKSKISGFTIIELLVVIVVIAILASISLVSYTSIFQKAKLATLQSDLTNASKTLKIYQSTYGSYPTSLDGNECPAAPTADANLCLKASSGTSYTDYLSDGTIFNLVATNNNTTYNITDSLSPQTYVDPNWLTIGTQTWAKANLNVGVMIASATAQTNNSVLEKYCYDNNEANCTTYGGLYQWDEAMQYVTTAGAQGICPADSHIPSDNDWKILEMQLGMSQAQADGTDWRGTDQGTQLKSGGSSGLNMLLAGYRHTSGSFNYLLSYARMWSSSESGIAAWTRHLTSTDIAVARITYIKGLGFSVRCLKN
jgi:uncharacterized protein (TIGR02145 family)/prepilin-type N-terminal cleavage/methylation domain-containing protein